MRFNLFTRRYFIASVMLFTALLMSGCQTLEEMAAADAHIVTSNTGPNGKVEPRGDIQVTPGTMQTIFFLPDPGYEIASVMVDGDDIGSLPSYVFANVRRNHVVSVKFEKKSQLSSTKSSPKKRVRKAKKKTSVPRKKTAPKQTVIAEKSPTKKPPTKKPVVAAVVVKAPAPTPAPTPVVEVAQKATTEELKTVTPDPVEITVVEAVTEVPVVDKPALQRLQNLKAHNARTRVTSFSGDAAAKGLSIAEEADQRDQGWGDYLVDMIMELSNRNGDTVTRFMHYKGLEQENDGDKTVIVFDRPVDIKGTALLTHAHKATKNDDQWLYLPSVKRVKRISSASKTGAFMGSEFSYEEFSSQEVDKFNFKWLQDEVFNGTDCYVVEARPIDPKSGYVRQVRWLDKDELRLQRIDYYDRKNSLLKTLTMSDYNRYLGKFWRAKTFNMVNHQSGRKTRLIWQNYQFDQGLTDNLFAKNSLKRNR